MVKRRRPRMSGSISGNRLTARPSLTLLSPTAEETGPDDADSPTAQQSKDSAVFHRPITYRLKKENHRQNDGVDERLDVGVSTPSSDNAKKVRSQKSRTMDCRTRWDKDITTSPQGRSRKSRTSGESIRLPLENVPERTSSKTSPRAESTEINKASSDSSTSQIFSQSPVVTNKACTTRTSSTKSPNEQDVEEALTPGAGRNRMYHLVSGEYVQSSVHSAPTRGSSGHVGRERSRTAVSSPRRSPVAPSTTSARRFPLVNRADILDGSRSRENRVSAKFAEFLDGDGAQGSEAIQRTSSCRSYRQHPYELPYAQTNEASPMQLLAEGMETRQGGLQPQTNETTPVAPNQPVREKSSTAAYAESR
jgi:hypothetical protein